MFKFIFGVSLKSEVMKAIGKRIKETQKVLNDELIRSRKNHAQRKVNLQIEADQKIAALHDEHEEEKASIIEKHVNAILPR